MKLEDLKKETPFKWRVQSTNEWGCTCVAYIDARDVQDLLDDVVGAHNWQVKYEEHKGNLFASIGINIEQRKNDNSVDGLGWVWKSDCGTESQVEKQKGEASDAFKRAAVMWGVGRFLYSLKIIKIKEVIKVGNKYHPAANGKRIYDINTHCNMLNRPPALTIEQFQSTKNATDKQILTVLQSFRMADDQRKVLTDIKDKL
jgi:hypothetical protein